MCMVHTRIHVHPQTYRPLHIYTLTNTCTCGTRENVCVPHSPEHWLSPIGARAWVAACSFPNPQFGAGLWVPGGGPDVSPHLTTVPLCGSFLQELRSCDTDDDVAMCFIKNQAAFEKYLEFLVGRVQAESVMVSTAVQEFYKVTLCPPALPPLPRPHAGSWLLDHLP